MHGPRCLEGQTHRQTICNFTGTTCQNSSSSRAPQSFVSALIITHGNEANPSPLSQCTFSAEGRLHTSMFGKADRGSEQMAYPIVQCSPSSHSVHSTHQSLAAKAGPDSLAQSPRVAPARTHHTTSGVAHLRMVPTAVWCLFPTQRGSGAQTGMEASTPHTSSVLETCVQERNS